MRNSTYYNLKLVEGTDIVNPLTTEVPNMIKIDETMHENAIAGVTLATELTNGTVHALMRENSDCAVIRFIATSEWKAGDSATVDGLPVTVLLPSGETLPDGAYVINANVLCILTGTNLTIYAERKNTENANEIAYNDTNVAAELTKLNSNLISMKTLDEIEMSCVEYFINNVYPTLGVDKANIINGVFVNNQYTAYIGIKPESNFASFLFVGYGIRAIHVSNTNGNWKSTVLNNR